MKISFNRRFNCNNIIKKKFKELLNKCLVILNFKDIFFINHKIISLILIEHTFKINFT